MEQSPPWETNSCSAGQEIPRHLWDPKVLYRVLKNPPLDPSLSEMNPAHTIIPYFHYPPENKLETLRTIP
jgi:hypothetical protein